MAKRGPLSNMADLGPNPVHATIPFWLLRPDNLSQQGPYRFAEPPDLIPLRCHKKLLIRTSDVPERQNRPLRDRFQRWTNQSLLPLGQFVYRL